jgi:radical SAM superfamily enzyme YgiQ (UPF0313 family)
MAKAQIYAMQLGNWGNVGSLPQAIGTIWSYALTKDFVRDNFEMARVFWENESSEEVIQDIGVKPDIFICSCYIWNWDRTYDVIEHVRNTYPDCLIVVGGPEPKYTLEWIQEHSEVDITVPYYGELAFVNILQEYLNNKDWNAVPGIITRDRHDKLYTYPEFTDIPSPYLNGFFDNLIANKRESTTRLRCVFESNRGCPYACTFCDIGALEYQKIRKFEIERCYAELEWIITHGLTSIDIADANFGILPRDEDIVDKIIELKEKYSWEGRVWPTWSKARGDRVIRLAKKLTDAGLDSLFGLSLQSFTQVTLDNVKRTNAFNLEGMSDIIKDMNDNGIPVYTEVIFPMPGDTYTNFKQGLYEMIDMPYTFNKFQVNHLSKLNNSEFADPNYENKFDVAWTKINGATKMYSDEKFSEIICTSTSTLSEEEVFEGMFFAKNFLIGMYFYGMIRITCNTLRNLDIAKRSETIDGIYQVLSNTEWFVKHKIEMRDHYFRALKKGDQFGQPFYNFYLQEFAVSHRLYREKLTDTLIEAMPEYKELLMLDYYSQWRNCAETIEYNTETYLPGTWHFNDNRSMLEKDYLGELYIKGRFDDRWRKQVILHNGQQIPTI